MVKQITGEWKKNVFDKKPIMRHFQLNHIIFRSGTMSSFFESQHGSLQLL